MLTRILKAPNKSVPDTELHLLEYPVVASPKLDGFRCLIDGEPKTSSMKEQPNEFIKKTLSKPELNGLDGELLVGLPTDPNSFNNSTGPLRRYAGEPDFKFYVFDSFLSPSQPYAQRWLLSVKEEFKHPRVVILPQEILYTPSEVVLFTDRCIDEGYEGAMLRTLTGKYKQGRATFKEMNIFKRKPLEDAEAEIIGFVEQMTNHNPKFIDEQGLSKRATNQDMLLGAGTLGSFVMKSPLWKKPFNLGGGKLNHSERLDVWNNREEFLGKKVTFRYQAHGSLEGPRQPIFHRFYKEL